MSNLIEKNIESVLTSIVNKGDFSGLNEEQKMLYYNKLCEVLSLNPVTRPFEYIAFKNKTVLYATKSCTEQLRKIHNISCEIIETKVVNEIYIVIAKVTDNQRTDTATGAVNIAGLKGDDLANAIMKAETKAKRRATLSICGLGILDESELETIQEAKKTNYASENESMPAKPAKQQETLLQQAIKDLHKCKTIDELKNVVAFHKEFINNEEFKNEGKKQQELILKRLKLSSIIASCNNFNELQQIKFNSEKILDSDLLAQISKKEQELSEIDDVEIAEFEEPPF